MIGSFLLVAAVAAGFPDWTGAVDKNHVWGRYLTASDLRHKFTIVVEYEPEKAHEQLLVAGPVASLNNALACTPPARRSWDNIVYPRESIVVFVSRGKGKSALVMKALERQDATSSAYAGAIRGWCAFYEGVTYPGAPQSDGRYPFVYMLPPEGTEPAYAGVVTDGAKTVAALRAAAAAYGKKHGPRPKWREFYGWIEEPKSFPQLKAALRAGKPLSSVSSACLGAVGSPDAAKAREAQVLYDAIEQARGDAIYRVYHNAGILPHTAAYDLGRLRRYWPGAPTHLADVEKKLSAYPVYQTLGEIYGLIAGWEARGEAEWTSKDVKTALEAIKKAKPKLQKIKGDNGNASAQGIAMALEPELDAWSARLGDMRKEKAK